MSSECRDWAGCVGRIQRWWNKSNHVVGVTCSVPWNAAATGEKPRTGRLYSSREEICEAALKAASIVPPLSSLPSAGPSSSSSSSAPSEGGHGDADNEVITGKLVYFVIFFSHRFELQTLRLAKSFK